jgi:amino acid adenylation domain-containing protein/FkbM family methyltransferase
MKNICLHDLIAAQAARTPDAIAVVFENERMTYRELDARANELASELQSLGVKPDDIVALCVERSTSMIAALLGILKSGAAYLPIDPAFPAERIAFMIEDSGARVVVNGGGQPPSAVQLNNDDSRGRLSSTEAVGDSSLAYVIYTSGSTGRPKGVCIEHRNIVNYVNAIVDALDLESGMSYATVTTIAADLGNTVIFPALATGGCLHVISKERSENGALLAEYFRRNTIDVLKIVPSHLAALRTGNPDLMPKRRLILGGEASRIEWIASLRAAMPACRIYNHYGPTETTVGVLTCRVEAEWPSAYAPIGLPLAGVSAYILDESLDLVTAGRTGELYIGGACVARGYLHRDDLTAQRFIVRNGERLYRTGDLARQLSGGSIEFCGRADDQVKIAGNRVEPGEVAAAIREHAAVSDAVVVASDASDGSKQLVAYLVPKQNEQPLWSARNTHVLPDGSPVAHLNKNETDYIYNEIFTLQAYLRHGITIDDGDTIVDAGANIGLFTVFANRIARNLRTISFEPNPAAYACLKANAEAWGSSVTCLPFGVSAEERTAELTFFEGLSLLSGFYADTATEREVVRNYVANQTDSDVAEEVGEVIEAHLRATSVEATLRPLSSVLAEENVERIDLLKVNVEKSELDVLRGIRNEDWAKIRQLVIEVDEERNLAPILEILERNGYESLVEQDAVLRRTDLCYVYAIRPSERGRLIREQEATAHVRPIPPSDRAILTPAALRRQLKSRLPQYMIPAAFVLIDRVPLNANGKIDRQALPQLVHEPAAAPAIAVVAGPRTPTERRLAAIWSELLNVSDIVPADDFFDLGGQSLVAIKAVSRIRDEFHVDLALRSVFEHTTLAALAEVIDRLAWLAKGASNVTQGAEAREEVTI